MSDYKPATVLPFHKLSKAGRSTEEQVAHEYVGLGQQDDTSGPVSAETTYLRLMLAAQDRHDEEDALNWIVPDNGPQI